MRMSRLLPMLALVAAVLAPGDGSAEDVAGNRPDSTPVFFSLERRILKLARELYEHREELSELLGELQGEYDAEVSELVQKRQNAPRHGLPLVTDSRQDYEVLIEDATEEYREDRANLENKYGRRIEEQQMQLGNALASPVEGGLGEKIDLYKPYSASREQLELYNAALNLQATANHLTARLRADRTDYALAVQTYDVMFELVTTVIEMNSEFVIRIDQRYRPEAYEIMGRLRRAKEKTGLARGVDPEVVRMEMEKLTKVLERMEKNLPKLDEMKAWAEKNAANLEPIINTIRLLKDNATVVRDAADWVGGIEESFAQLNVTLPPLVEYDLIESDFEITMPDQQ